MGWIVGVAACSGGERRDPVAEYAADLEIAPDKQPSITRAVQPGAWLLEVREQDIDVRVVVDAAGVHAELEDQVPRHGTLYKVVRVAEAGELRIRLRSADHHTKHGRATLRLARWQRTIDAPASELESGFVAFGDAGEQTALATPAAWAVAADKLHEALTHFEAAGDDAARAQASYSLASIQFGARDEWTATVIASEIAADAFRDVDDEVGLQNAWTLRSAAELQLAAGMDSGTQRAEQHAMYEAADRRLKEAASFFTAHQMPIRAEFAVNLRGIRAVKVGDYDTAAEFLAQAVSMARANQDVGEEAKALANLAAVHNLNGYMAQAAQEYAALMSIVDRKAQPYLYATLLGNYGFCLVALGEFDRALASHTEALEIYTTLGKKEERALGLAALGGLYFRMGDANRALETLRAAIVAQEQVSDTDGLASTLRIAANTASEIGDHATALDYLRRSARIDANPHSVARTSVLIAGELRALGDLTAAEEALAKPLAYTNPLVRADAIEERARLHLARRANAAAIDDLRSADRQYASLGLEFDRIDTNTALSQALLGIDDIKGAGAAADEAVAIASRIRAKSANPEWRARFLAARYSPFEARIAVDLAEPASGEDAAWRAFRTAERVRARSLADELASGARGEMQSDPRDAELRARLTTQQLRLESRIQRQDVDEAGTLELRRSIEETRAQIDSNRLRGGGVKANESALPESLRLLRQKLPADTAVLAYFVGDSGTHAWLLTRRVLAHTKLTGRKGLERAVEAATNELRNPAQGVAAGRALGAMLFGHLLDGVNEHRLLVIADGPLNGVPFAALTVPGPDRSMLVDRFVIGYAPSLALAMNTPRRQSTRPTRVAVISDPVYAPDDRRLRLAANGAGGNYRSPPPPSPNNLTRLPYSAMEANAVTKEYGDAAIIGLAGFDASAERVLSLPSSDLAVLHFATHALARRDSPEQSALYLSEYSPDGRGLTDSRLTVGDITRAGLHAEVVVLSGCATGDGSELRGEGVLGLTYGFLANGSRAVVAALWPIEDATTARFMSEFYRAYRASGRPAEALRTAQLRTRGAAAPAVWSSFVVRANEFP